MALSKEQETLIEKLFKERMKEQFELGLKGGAVAVSKIVLSKLNDNKKPLMTRIADVKSFCKHPLEHRDIPTTNNEDKSAEEENT